ncbi:MAG: glycogen debranching enzyme family protein [Anaerolineae bacterium]|nr:glycogen debranching enzyme family protein [Anaerolineae bacterium]
MLDFERDLGSDLHFSASREWLVTNGIGGYACGTLSGVLTRHYHGLLVAALQPPVGRTLLLTKLDETAIYRDQAYDLYANRWAEDEIAPRGFVHLERFHLDGTTPVWTYAMSDALLEKRVWMQPGSNTTYVHYHLPRAGAPVTLTLRVIVNHRDHHQSTRSCAGMPTLSVEPVRRGLRIRAGAGTPPLFLLSADARATLRHEWRPNFYLSLEAYRGIDPLDDNLYAGFFETTLQPGGSATIVASTDESPALDGTAAYRARQEHENDLRRRAVRLLDTAPSDMDHLVLAADQFIVDRPLPPVAGKGRPQVVRGQSVIAGYPWFGDWGRDTMISLPGLTLATGRAEVAGSILRTFAHHVDQGMLPNRFPDAGQAPEYNTVDATLWYFEAIRAYYQATGDQDLVRELLPVLREIIAWHLRGTRYGIGVDTDDGLLRAGEEGVQLTWMDAKVDDWVVTPRIGKPVEINALWYNALRIMAALEEIVGQAPGTYECMAARVLLGFQRFWNHARGYCYDVIDGPGGADPALRPNQLLAVSLPHSALAPDRQRAVVDACARHLLASHGLRSLAPAEEGYIGHYGGDRRTRDAAYHQGTVWGWLIGPFVRAHLRVYGQPQAARSFLYPLLRQLRSHGVGTLSEIFDGDAPFTPRGCFAQAWTVAEVLAAWQATIDAEVTGG